MNSLCNSGVHRRRAPPRPFPPRAAFPSFPRPPLAFARFPRPDVDARASPLALARFLPPPRPSLARAPSLASSSVLRRVLAERVLVQRPDAVLARRAAHDDVVQPILRSRFASRRVSPFVARLDRARRRRPRVDVARVRVRFASRRRAVVVVARVVARASSRAPACRRARRRARRRRRRRGPRTGARTGRPPCATEYSSTARRDARSIAIRAREPRRRRSIERRATLVATRRSRSIAMRARARVAISGHLRVVTVIHPRCVHCV